LATTLDEAGVAPGFNIKHVFASEIDGDEGEGARAFIAMNCAPEIMYRDMTKRKQITGGHCD